MPKNQNRSWAKIFRCSAVSGELLEALGVNDV